MPEDSSFDQVNSAAEKTKEFMEGTYLSAMQAATQFNAKLLEFARINNEAVMSYMSELSRVKSPTDAVEITTRHAREQLATLTAQAKELAAIGQQATFKTMMPPFKNGGPRGMS
jgi:hypothetical protein